MPLVGQMEKWWGSVMDVGLDPELTKWSVCSGPAIVLTGKGYKEHHWLVIPPSTTSVISTPIFPILTLPCLCLLAPSPVPKTNTGGVELLSVFVARPVLAPTLVVPSPPSYSMKRNTE